MLTHEQIWRGIDRLALRNDLSPSGLAKRAGLDPTTFNKSKRITREGKLRWPSTESLAKILEATSTSMADFVSLIDGAEAEGSPAAMTRLKCIRFSQLSLPDALDVSGYPKSGPWEDIDFPMVDDPNAYVLELDADLAPPFYRVGDLMVVSPRSSIRRQDRVLVRHKSGQITVVVLARRTAQRLTLTSLEDPEEDYQLDVKEVEWLARIMWVSQ